MIRRSAKLSSDHQKDFCLSDYSDLPDFRCVVDPKKDFLTVCGCRIICQQAVFSVAETNSLPPQTVKKTFLHSLLVKKTFLDSLLSDHLQTSGSPVHISMFFLIVDFWDFVELETIPLEQMISHPSEGSGTCPDMR